MSKEPKSPYIPGQWCPADPDIRPPHDALVLRTGIPPFEAYVITEFWSRHCLDKDAEHPITHVCVRPDWTPPPLPEPEWSHLAKGIGHFRESLIGIEFSVEPNSWWDLTDSNVPADVRAYLRECFDSRRDIGPLREQVQKLKLEVDALELAAIPCPDAAASESALGADGWIPVDKDEEPPQGSEIRWRSGDGEVWTDVWDRECWRRSWHHYCTDAYPYEYYRIVT